MISPIADGFSFSKAAPTFRFPVAVLPVEESEALLPDFLVGRRLDAPPRRSRSDGCAEVSFARKDGFHLLVFEAADAAEQLPIDGTATTISTTIVSSASDDAVDILRPLLIFLGEIFCGISGNKPKTRGRDLRMVTG
jgi:hypothetical protein